MKHFNFSLRTAITGIIVISSSIAGSSEAMAAGLASSANNIQDNGYKWPVGIAAWYETPTATPTPAPDVCIPAGTRIMGLRQDPKNSNYDIVELNPTSYWFSPPQGQVDFKKPPAAGGAPIAGACYSDPQVGPANGTIYPNQPLSIQASDLPAASYQSGFEFGTLVVPFKAQLSGKKSLSGSATIGGYLGYDFPIEYQAVTLAPVLFAGFSPISVAGTSGSSTTSQTLSGLSYGGGLVATFKSSFQVGLILGFDHVDSTYQYNDKPWFSFEIGYSFSQ